MELKKIISYGNSYDHIHKELKSTSIWSRPFTNGSIHIIQYETKISEREAPNSIEPTKLSLSYMVIVALEGKDDEGLNFVLNILEVNTNQGLRNDCNKIGFTIVTKKPPFGNPTQKVLKFSNTFT